MNSLSELMKSITSLQDKIKPFYFNDSIPPSFKASNSISDIAQSLSDRMSPSNKLSSITAESNVFNQVSKNKIFATPFYNESYLFTPLSIASKYKSLSEIAESQFLVTNSLNDLFKKFDTSPFGFNTLNNAIHGLSNTYLRDIAKRHHWGNAEVVKEVNESIASVSKEYLSENNFVTQDGLEKFGVSLISNIQQLYLNSKSKSVKAYLWELIQVISVLFNFYISAYTLNDISNKEAVSISTSEIREIENKLLEKIDLEFKKLNNTRIAQTNVNLRKSCSKRAQIKGLVKTGQIVTVIEIRHKWLLVTYIDNETEEPFSGFVYKKYFKSIEG